ncbi:MAG: RNA polymerase subunit sigma-24 [Acidobacteriota bacterium]|nr:RNA polymerase subunit sigma-24 [Acidobacteriota bacterium]
MKTRLSVLCVVFGSLLGFTAFGHLNGPAFAENAPCQTKTTRARDLTPEQAASLETKLEQDPHDLASRTRLLRYYFGSYRFQDRSVREEMRAARTRHILWLVRNRPEAEALGSPEGTIDRHSDPEGYAEGKNAWLDRLEREPANLKVVEHAVRFFTITDSDLAIELLQQGQLLDEGNAKWPRELGHRYSLEIIGEDSPAKVTELAEKAVVQYERAYELSDGPRRTGLVKDLARMAITANQYEKAKEYAQTLLAHDSTDWNSRDHLHHGHLVLGRTALAEGDIEEAKRRLIAAGEATRTSEPNAVEPNMFLARELLQRGEKEVVLEYFSLCSDSWEGGRDKLEKWSVLVQAGLEPDFGGNLSF